MFVENNVSSETMSKTGVIFKTILGMIIVFAIAIPNFMNGKVAFYSLFSSSGLIAPLFITIILGIVWYTLFMLLQKDKGPVLNVVIFVITCVLEGLFLGNALVISTFYISYYAEDLSLSTVYSALAIATVGTLISVVGALFVVSTFDLENGKFPVLKNIFKIVWILAISSAIAWGIAFILNLFGLSAFYEMLIEAFYGLGPISIIISIVAVFIAEFLLLATLAAVKKMINTSPPHLEYFAAMTIVISIVRVYLEIFKLTLKLLARSRD